MAKSHDLGRNSEQLAADHLQRLGYEIVASNYRVGHKEVDLIVRRGDVIAFVEVKARAGGGCGHPLEAITWAKRREIAYVARVWIAGNPGQARVFRFDAVAILWQAGQPVIEHVPNAWRL